MPDILNYLQDTSVTGFSATDNQYAHNQTNVSEQVDVNSNVPDSQMVKDAEKIAGPSQEQPRGLLQRLMRKLLGKR